MSGGQIVLPAAGAPSPLKPYDITGSAITAAGNSVAERTNVQAGAINTLGGKMSGGAEVIVGGIPQIASAGNSNPAGSFAGMQGLKAGLLESSKYDALGSAPPMLVQGGRKRKTPKHNARRINKHTRRHRRSTRGHSRLRSSRRRVRIHHRQKTHKK
jgi:hypothetical protein